MARKATETQPQPAAIVKKAWGKGFEEEFNAIKGFKEGDIPSNNMGVIKDNKTIGRGSKEANKQI